MTEQDEKKAPHLSVVRSTTDKIIEQKVLEGQIEGEDFFTEEEQQAALAELAMLPIPQFCRV